MIKSVTCSKVLIYHRREQLVTSRWTSILMLRRFYSVALLNACLAIANAVEVGDGNWTWQGGSSCLAPDVAQRIQERCHCRSWSGCLLLDKLYLRP